MERQAQLEREKHEKEKKKIIEEYNLILNKLREENIKNENRHKNVMNAKYEELQKKKMNIYKRWRNYLSKNKILI